MDFMRGALSEGGDPIIAMPSVTAKGVSRIVPQLKPGAGGYHTRTCALLLPNTVFVTVW